MLVYLFFPVDKMKFLMAHILIISMTLMIDCHAVPIRDKSISTKAAVLDTYLPTKDSAGDDRISAVKSRSKRATACDVKSKTRFLQHPLRTTSGESKVIEIICKSYGKQLYGFVDGCFKIDSKSIVKNANNNLCDGGIKIKIPLRTGCNDC